MIPMEAIKQMLARNEPTLSLYLDLDRGKQENQATQPAWRIYLKDALRDAEREAPQADVWQQIKARVERFFEDYQAQAKGLAAFFTTDDEQVYELPVSVEPRRSFGKALVVPLLWAMGEYEPYLIVMVDQEKAELITAYLGNTTVEGKVESDLKAYDFEEEMLVSEPMPVVAGARGLTQGANLESVQNRINEHISHFHREVVGQIETLVKKHPHIRLVIGGAAESAHAVHDLLPAQLADSTVGVMPIPLRLSVQEVLQHVLPTALDYERDQEMVLLQQVIDFAKAGGRGALGRKAVNDALMMQRVETLILPWRVEDEVKATDLSTRAFESGGSVELVHGAAADRLKEEGGIAARLYYAI